MKELSGKEYAALLSLFGAFSTLRGNAPRMESRLSPEDYALLVDATNKIDEALEKILATVPVKKLRRLKFELQNTGLYVKVEPNGLLSQMPEPYSYTPVSAINALLSYLVRGECLLCDKTDTESRKCPYRSLIEVTLPHEAGHENEDGRCRYADCAIEVEG